MHDMVVWVQQEFFVINRRWQTMTLGWNVAMTHGLRKMQACEPGPYGWCMSGILQIQTLHWQNQAELIIASIVHTVSEIWWEKLIFMVVLVMRIGTYLIPYKRNGICLKESLVNLKTIYTFKSICWVVERLLDPAHTEVQWMDGNFYSTKILINES